MNGHQSSLRRSNLPERVQPVQPPVSDADAVYRKVLFRLLPMLVIVYVIAYIDRSNVGFAKLGFMRDLGFSDTVFGIGAGVFYAGYMIFEIPSNLMLARIGFRKTLLRIMAGLDKEYNGEAWVAEGARVGYLEQEPQLDATKTVRETEADAFACDLLIPAADYERFCANGDFSVAAIRRFAGRIGIASGIVAGRLQHEQKVPFSRGNQLKRRFDFGD
jgi:MFS family permease